MARRLAQREVLNGLMHHTMPLIDQAAIGPYLRDVSDHLLWIADMVSTFATRSPV